jgi:hypothetical protein
MNCIEFEHIVNDLAHGRIVDASARDCGLAHAQVCANCAGRLGEERALSALLRTLAASDEEKSAPSATESVLIAAFRRNAATGAAGSRQVRQRRVRWAWGAAAMILLALGAFGLAVRLGIQRSLMNQESMIDERSSLPAPVPGKIGGDLTREPEKNAAGQVPRRAVVRPHKNRYPRASHQASARPRTKQILIRDEMTLYADDADVVTDFIPLTDGDSLRQIERGELIRVRMPRAALLKFGLPMNVERAGVPVKADLLVGEDGQARAIRFVR